MYNKKTSMDDKLDLKKSLLKSEHFQKSYCPLSEQKSQRKRNFEYIFLRVYKYDKIYIRLITNKLYQINSYLHVNLYNCTMKFENFIAL